MEVLMFSPMQPTNCLAFSQAVLLFDGVLFLAQSSLSPDLRLDHEGSSRLLGPVAGAVTGRLSKAYSFWDMSIRSLYGLQSMYLYSHICTCLSEAFPCLSLVKSTRPPSDYLASLLARRSSLPVWSGLHKYPAGTEAMRLSPIMYA